MARRASGGAARHVALLRGINVGGKNRLKMAVLVAAFEDAGCTDVRTYIQSGNVVFSAPARLLASLARELPRRIAERSGLDLPVVLRTADEIEEALERNPFLAEGAAEDTLHLGFLREKPDAARVRSLDPERSPGDRFLVRGRELYLHLPGGVARTKLTSAWLDARLGTVVTVRNWRTVQKLAALARE